MPNDEVKGRTLLIKRLFLIGVVFLSSLPRLVAAAPAPPNITAKSAIVNEASTGKILYEKKA